MTTWKDFNTGNGKHKYPHILLVILIVVSIMGSNIIPKEIAYATDGPPEGVMFTVPGSGPESGDPNSSGDSNSSGNGAGGDPGMNGSSGEAGMSGAGGEPGMNGSSGEAAASGAGGEAGVNGLSDGSGMNGLSADPGMSGASGDPGMNGLSGEPGVNGSSGAAGGSSAETGGVVWSVTFYSNGILWDTLTVNDGETCGIPVLPPKDETRFWPESADSFAGWHTAPQGDESAAEFDLNTTPVTNDTDLFAHFNDNDTDLIAPLDVTFLVRFKNVNGVIFETHQLKPGDPVMSTTATIVAPANSRFLYWYAEEDYSGSGQPAPFVFGNTADRDLTLAPYITNEYFMFFVSAGTQVKPVTVKVGETAAAPSPPTRSGYDFSHWSLTEGGAAYSFETPVNKDTWLYAVWTPKIVNYTVVYWLEIPDFSGTPVPGTKGAYAYSYSETRTGLAGSQTNIQAMSANAKNSSIEMTYSTYQEAHNTTILGSGISVVNVYCKRNVFTIWFDLFVCSWNGRTAMTFKNTKYVTNGPLYYINVKYEMNISDIWPYQGAADFENDCCKFLGWMAIDTLGLTSPTVWATKRLVITKDMLPAEADGTDVGVIAYWTHGNQYTVTYWMEQLPEQVDAPGLTTTTDNDKTYVKSEKYSQLLNSPNNIYAKALEGVEYVSGNSGAPDTTTYDFFYDRNRYTLNFNSMGGSYVPAATDIMYDQSLSDKKPADPTKTLDGFEYTFKGWYLEPDYFSEFIFDGSAMPARDMALYAKWESTQFAVNFYNDLTKNSLIDGQGVGKALNENLKPGEAPYDIGQPVEGFGTFDGWYVFIDGWYVFIDGIQKIMRFSFETPIISDVDLHAAWKLTGYKVTYNIGRGTGTAPADNNLYNFEMETRVKGQEGFTPPEGTLFIGWVEKNTDKFYYPGTIATLYGDAEFIAQYGDRDAYTQITFHSNYPTGPNESFTWNVEKNSSFKLYNGASFRHQGSRITGWDASPTKEIADYKLEAEYTIGNDPVNLYAIWAIVKTVEFLPGDNGTLGGKAIFASIPSGTSWGDFFNGSANVVPAAEPNKGYVFTGWNPVLPDDGFKITEDMVFEAQWELAVITITITGNSAQYTYNGEEQSVDGYVTATTPPEGTALSDYDIAIEAAATGASSTDATKPGNPVLNEVSRYDVKVLFNDKEMGAEYINVVTEAGKLIVNPAPLVITVLDQTLQRGSPIPSEFDFSVTGLLGKDVGKESSVIKGKAIYRTKYTPAASAGETFPVELDGLVSDNYDIKIVPGNIYVAGETGGTTGGGTTGGGTTGGGTTGGGTTGGGTTNPPSIGPAVDTTQYPSEVTTTDNVQNTSSAGTTIPILEEKSQPVNIMSWALLNLMLTLVTVLIAACLLITALLNRKKEDDPDYGPDYDPDPEMRKTENHMSLRLLSVAAAVIAVLLFAFTQNILQSMVFADQWTVWHAAIAAATILLARFSRKKHEEDDEDLQKEAL